MTSYNEHDNDVIAWPNGHQFVNRAARDFTHVYLYVAGIPGSQGLDGVPGLEGHRGVPGSKGIHGNRGPDGLHGTQGLTVRHLEEYTNPGWGTPYVRWLGVPGTPYVRWLGVADGVRPMSGGSGSRVGYALCHMARYPG